MLKALCLAAALMVATPALAQESRLRSARVSAPDVVKTATFYQSVFGWGLEPNASGDQSSEKPAEPSP
mgnify:CR=1 FL=1